MCFCPVVRFRAGGTVAITWDYVESCETAQAAPLRTLHMAVILGKLVVSRGAEMKEYVWRGGGGVEKKPFWRRARGVFATRPLKDGQCNVRLIHDVAKGATTNDRTAQHGRAVADPAVPTRKPASASASASSSAPRQPIRPKSAEPCGETARDKGPPRTCLSASSCELLRGMSSSSDEDGLEEELLSLTSTSANKRKRISSSSNALAESKAHVQSLVVVTKTQKQSFCEAQLAESQKLRHHQEQLAESSAALANSAALVRRHCPTAHELAASQKECTRRKGAAEAAKLRLTESQQELAETRARCSRQEAQLDEYRADIAKFKIQKVRESASSASVLAAASRRQGQLAREHELGLQLTRARQTLQDERKASAELQATGKRAEAKAEAHAQSAVARAEQAEACMRGAEGRAGLGGPLPQTHGRSKHLFYLVSMQYAQQFCGN